MFPISDLIVTQHALRNPSSLPDMAKHGDGSRFDLGSITDHSPDRSGRLVQISRLPDGFHFLHDGHHRCVSLCLIGRQHLHDSEYEITDWTYEDYFDVVFADSMEKSWLTPMNLRDHIRDPEFFTFKDMAFATLKHRGEEDAMLYIEQNAHMYRQQRQYNMVKTLAGQYTPALYES